MTPSTASIGSVVTFEDDEKVDDDDDDEQRRRSNTGYKDTNSASVGSLETTNRTTTAEATAITHGTDSAQESINSTCACVNCKEKDEIIQHQAREINELSQRLKLFETKKNNQNIPNQSSLNDGNDSQSSMPYLALPETIDEVDFTRDTKTTMEPESHIPHATSTIIRLSRALEKKRQERFLQTKICPEQSHPTPSKQEQLQQEQLQQDEDDSHQHNDVGMTHTNTNLDMIKTTQRVRHYQIQIGGHAAFYSGPVMILEEQKQDLKNQPDSKQQQRQQLVPHGLGGCVRFVNGNVYVGSMEEGWMQGIGTMYLENGTIQRGHFEQNEFKY